VQEIKQEEEAARIGRTYEREWMNGSSRGLLFINVTSD
jgi:hypothetical protein